MKFERKITAHGGSTGLTLPQDLLKYLNLQQGDTIIIQDEIGKKGAFITLWKKEGDNLDTNTNPITE